MCAEVQVEFRSVWHPSWADLRPVSAGATQPASSYELRTQTRRAA
ncbi:MAG: hypothetical protein K0S10_1912, partial [Rubrobacteraceae bacterium]|nr:hypothetical protein [Rubrobacteraceae bacterium]